MSESSISSVDRNMTEIVDYRSQESKPSLLRNKEMYNVDNFLPLTENDIERYFKSNEKLVKDLSSFIEVYLAASTWEIQAMGIRIVSQLAPEQQYKFRERICSLVEKVLAQEDWHIKASGASMISWAPTEVQNELREELSNIIKTGLLDDRMYVREIALSMVPYAPAETQEDLRKMFADRDMLPREKSSLKIGAKQKTGDDIEPGSALDLKLKALAARTPLYDKSTGRFFRKDFEKDGSETILLDAVPGQPDKTLRERLIIRTVTVDAYFSWKKAYESSDFWKSKGFDYVPIEPIVKVKSDGARHVDVFSRVLKGPSIGMWQNETEIFKENIHEQINKITACLVELGIDHGHIHYGNFVVYFSRNKNGEVDLTSPPRLYLIDFDQAEFSG